LTDNDVVYSAPTFERCPRNHYEVVCTPAGVAWDEFFAPAFNVHRNVADGVTIIVAPTPPRTQPRSAIYNIHQCKSPTVKAFATLVETPRIVEAIKAAGKRREIDDHEVATLFRSSGWSLS
jgi:hypothetical protein